MKLTPLDLRKQDFTRVMRGYDADEVQAFLQMLSEQWEDVLATNRRLEDRVQNLENKLEHYERVEEALQEALRTARANKEEVLENAQREAEVTIKEAEARADEITREARTDRDRFRSEADRLAGRRGEIVARLRAFLLSEMELLARFEGEDPIGFIQLLPADGRRRLQENRDADLNTLVKGEEAPAPPEPAEAPPRAAAPEREPAGQEEAPLDYPERTAARHQEEEPPPTTAAAPAAETTPKPASVAESEAAAEEEQDQPGWIVNALFAADEIPEEEAHVAELPAPPDDADEEDEEDIVPTSEEIEKIRRILNDMDS